MNVVVGGGWAGLAAAAELAAAGQPVTVFEAAAEPGGRARRIRQGGRIGDNGQHLLIGAYREYLRLLRLVGADPGGLFDRQPLDLHMHGLDGQGLRLRLPALPAPLHVLAGLAMARGIGLRGRLAALRLGAQLGRPPDEGGADETVRAFLTRLRQPPALIDRLWEPLCLAMLNARIDEASAVLFRRVLHDAFARDRRDSDLLLARTDVGRQFPDPACDFIRGRGGAVRLGARVTGLLTGVSRVTGVRLADGTVLKADEVVLAVPPPAAARLLRPIPATAALAARLAELGSNPICTAYLRYPPQVRLTQPFIGVLGGTSQWVFDLGPTGRPGWMGIVVSGSGPHLGWSRAEWMARMADELGRLNPGWPAPLEAQVVREKRATFRATPGIDVLRPACETPLENLHLAGDAVATGYPATLEGAIRSGVRAARRILGRRPPGVEAPRGSPHHPALAPANPAPLSPAPHAPRPR